MSKKARVYVDFHVLQTLPPSCVNRDDTGSPKTAVYGGVTRARISSQAWKKAMRDMFKDTFDDEETGKRTKMAATMVAEKIAELTGNSDDEKNRREAENALNLASIKTKDGKTDALLFISEAQAEALAQLAANKETDKKLYRKALLEQPSVDMALFGRMVASDPSLNYDAAAQVAHSISTHAVHNEYDYFTAVDDLAPEDNAGAGHLGTVEFNSATMYRYATVGINELAENLGEKTGEAVRKFAEAFILAMPTGRQNTFANRTVPDMIYITIRNDQPVNLAGAFENPVRAASSGYVEPSKKALAEYAQQIYSNFVGEPEKAYVCGQGDCLDSLGEKYTLPVMLERLEQTVSAILNGEDLQ